MAVIKALVLPPAFQLILALAGLVLLRRWRRSGTALIILAVASLYLLSIVPVSRTLVMALETCPPLGETVTAGDRQAIVVLGGGRYPAAPEYRGDSVDADTLERLRYAAFLRDKTGLPILVSGGAVMNETVPEAEAMNRTLQQSFHTRADWLEDRSRNTMENADYSARMLRLHDIERVFLVTHAAHMRRSVWAFEHAGLDVTPAPTAYDSYKLTDSRVPWFIPTLEALNASHRALYEYYGMWWYRLSK